MRLVRYREIQAMMYAKTKKDGMQVPNGFGYAAWQSALADIAAEIDEKKFITLKANIGPKGARKTVLLSDLIDGEAQPGHLCCEVMQEEWRAIIKPLLAQIPEPESDIPEVVEAEKSADKALKDLEAANRENEKLQAEIAKLKSQNGETPTIH